MKVSILIPTLGEREEEIKRLLNSLQAQKYANIEVVIVSQSNHKAIANIVDEYENLNIKHIVIEKKGLSIARNEGIRRTEGDIIVLSDDDCWYPKNAISDIVKQFNEKEQINVLLTEIYDPISGQLYKSYSSKAEFLNNKLKLMSKSSIEIAYKKEKMENNSFDERLGLGGEFVCGEEIDFLLNNFKKNTFYFKPLVSVYHQKKMAGNTPGQIIAKGAVYGKHYSVFIFMLVLLRDLVIKKENNIKKFFEGYYAYHKGAS